MYTNTQFIKYSWGGSIQKDTEIYFYLICAVTRNILLRTTDRERVI